MWRFLLQQFNTNTMSKSQMLEIDYDKKTGVYFKWNFSDIYDPNHYFRHFIIINSKETQKAKEFVSAYVNRVVAGDFYKIIYGSQTKAVKNLRFREKMFKEYFDSKKYLKDMDLKVVQIESLLQKFQEEQLQYSEACIIAIYIDQDIVKKRIIERIKEKREKGLYNFLTFIYGPYKCNTVSINSGIHQLSNIFENKPIAHMVSYQMNIVYQAAIWKASLTITLNNGDLMVQNEKKWKQIQQNKIQRHYYGPSIKYVYDILQLYCFEFLTGNYDLLVQFQYKTFSNSIYKSEKRIIINYDYKEQMMKSLDYSQHAHLYEDGTMGLQENPFTSMSRVKYIKLMTGNCRSD